MPVMNMPDLTGALKHYGEQLANVTPAERKALDATLKLLGNMIDAPYGAQHRLLATAWMDGYVAGMDKVLEGLKES